MKSKTIALAAAAIAAAFTIGAAQAQLPSLAGPPAAAADNGQKLTNARGYSLTVPGDWIVATDYEGADFMMGSADLSVIFDTPVPERYDRALSLLGLKAWTLSPEAGHA